ncbi:MAG: hypothetical protein NC187_09565, partial [Candidatus Amulumruptor caecigallinarius]|nr:hypothetical protein [Candidatus Amulumruptor caecigallinarius]MCM1454733.1 hypothetical protein [bacterium]
PAQQSVNQRMHHGASLHIDGNCRFCNTLLFLYGVILILRISFQLSLSSFLRGGLEYLREFCKIC